MSIANVTESALLSLIFTATTWANYAINATSSPQTSIAVGLHTADPGEVGSMSTSETTYTSYARQDIPRTTATPGWVVTAGSVSPTANITFATGTGGSGTITFFSTGKTGGGGQAILFSGSVSPSISVGNLISPVLTQATTCSID